MEFMVYSKKFNNWLWNPSFWLPPNITWEDLKNKSANIYYPQYNDLWMSLLLAFCIIILRNIFEKFIAYPIGRKYGLKNNHQKLKTFNDDKEKLFKSTLKLNGHNANDRTINDYINESEKNIRHPSNELKNGFYKSYQSSALNDISNHTGLSQFKILKYLRQKHISSKNYSKLTKFSESFWRFTYYITAFFYGLTILYNKPWLWDTKYCWTDYPFQHVSRDIYWYYMIQMGFYCSLMVSQFMDVKRKDFWQMFTHHVCTLLLMTFSWATNLVRIGTLVLVIHDAVDFWLEATKITNYCKKPKLCNVIFCIFIVTWFLTRLVIFPYRVIYPAMFQAHKVLKTFFAAYYVYNSLLLLLLALNIFWFVIICKMAYKSIKYGEVKKDERSSSEDETRQDAKNN